MSDERLKLSAQDLEALPAGSAIVRDDAEAFISHDAPHRVKTRLWGTSQMAGMFSSDWVAQGHAELLWKPTS